MTKWQLFQQIDQSFQIHRSYGSMLEGEADELKVLLIVGLCIRLSGKGTLFLAASFKYFNFFFKFVGSMFWGLWKLWGQEWGERPKSSDSISQKPVSTKEYASLSHLNKWENHLVSCGSFSTSSNAFSSIFLLVCLLQNLGKVAPPSIGDLSSGPSFHTLCLWVSVRFGMSWINWSSNLSCAHFSRHYGIFGAFIPLCVYYGAIRRKGIWWLLEKKKKRFCRGTE